LKGKRIDYQQKNAGKDELQILAGILNFDYA